MIWQIFLLEALKLVLKNNHFIFNKEFLSNCWNRYRYYLEVRWYLEIKFYEKCKNEFGVNKGKYIEENRHRFSDDYYIALDATNINSTKLLYILNNIYDNIKFIIKQHNLYLPFLYTMVNKDLRPTTFGWTHIRYWYSEMCFYLPLTTTNNAKYLLHWLYEFAP